MLTKPVAQPKPKVQTGRRTRLHEKCMKAFRDAVWARDGATFGRERHADCVGCHRIVWRSGYPLGEVHHKLPRSTHPEAKYDPANGEIRCHDCHEAVR